MSARKVVNLTRIRVGQVIDLTGTARFKRSLVRTRRSLLACVVMVLFFSRPTVANPNSSNDVEHLRALQHRFREVAVKIKPSIVRIETVGGAQPLEARPQRRDENKDDPQGPPAPRPRNQNPFHDAPGGGGFVIADGPTTGIVYSADGYIVTSSFNFVREPSIITVTFADGRRAAADLIARDQVRKIALLKVDATGLTPAIWAPREEIRVGQWAVALGLGFGSEEPSITRGIVSALNRMHGNAVQTDAKLSPANYGGPLCDLDGRVIGLSVPMAQRPGELAGVEMYDSGVGFAVPRNRLEPIVEELKKGNSYYRGWLGIVFDPRKPDSLVVRNIADPSPARDAGIMMGDRLIEAGGKRLKHYGHLVQTLYMVPAGERVKLRVDREGVEAEMELTLARNTELGPLPPVEEPLDPAQQNPEAQPPPEEDELEEGPPEDE